MRRYLLILFVALTASLTMSAQYVVSDKYDLCLRTPATK